MKYVLLAAPLALIACQAPAPQATMSLAQAEAHCTVRATRFAQTPIPTRTETGGISVGLQADTPDSFMVRDFYRRCVYANSGQRPTTMPDIPVYN